MTGHRVGNLVRKEQDRILREMRDRGYSMPVIATFIGVPVGRLRSRVYKATRLEFLEGGRRV
mgnify:CR=1 FL=1